MNEVTWTVTEPNGAVKMVGKQVQLPHYDAFEITKDTTKEMKVTIDRWNLMRQSLLDNGLMKSK